METITMATILTNFGSVVTAVLSNITAFANTIVETPLIMVFLGLSFASAVGSLVSRWIRG